jgi:hypothetical protein
MNDWTRAAIYLSKLGQPIQIYDLRNHLPIYPQCLWIIFCPSLADSALMSSYLAPTYRVDQIAIRNNAFNAILFKDFEVCANHSFL